MPLPVLSVLALFLTASALRADERIMNAIKGLHYLTAPNQVQLDRKNKAPMIENDGDMFSYNPYQYRCCQHNVAHAWPYFAEHLWMATPSGGLAAALYAPSSVTARVEKGVTVRIDMETSYPFSGKVECTVHPSVSVAFPLLFRVPGWCAGPARVTVNGMPLEAKAPAGAWVEINRTWKEGDRVSLEFPQETVVKVWTANRNTVSVRRRKCQRLGYFALWQHGSYGNRGH